MNTISAFLSWEGAGLTIALVIGLTGLWTWKSGHRIRANWMTRLIRLGGGLAAVLGAGLFVSSGTHAISVAMMFARNPPPGQLIDVGGYRMHMLAEGERRGNPTVIWVPGGHSFGYNLYNYHKIFRAETRSILFDRPSSGWSDVGPYPRTTAREIEEFDRMITMSGEQGPFVLVGHSYGGLFASQYAMHHPDKIAALVLLDSGNPINWENPEAAAFMAQYSRITFYDGLLAALGIPYSIQGAAGGAALEELLAVYAKALHDVWPQVLDLNKASMNVLGTASIFSESGTAAFFEQGRTIAGALNGKPVTYITFLGGMDLESAEAREVVRGITGQDQAGVEQQIRGLRRNREDMKSLSDRFVSVSIPDGATHNFPYETPDFVVHHVRRTMALATGGSNAAEGGH